MEGRLPHEDVSTDLSGPGARAARSTRPEVTSYVLARLTRALPEGTGARSQRAPAVPATLTSCISRSVSNPPPPPPPISPVLVLLLTHRCSLQLLDQLLQANEYKVVGEAWSTPEKRKAICQFWHRLDGEPEYRTDRRILNSRMGGIQSDPKTDTPRAAQLGRTRSPRWTRSGTWTRRFCSRRSVTAPYAS